MVPDDIAALKDKAKYSAAAKDFNSAYKVLIYAQKIQPDDLSIPLDIAGIFLMTGDKSYAPRTCQLLAETTLDIKAKLKSSRGALQRDLKDLLQRANMYIKFAKCIS